MRHETSQRSRDARVGQIEFGLAHGRRVQFHLSGGRRDVGLVEFSLRFGRRFPVARHLHLRGLRAGLRSGKSNWLSDTANAPADRYLLKSAAANFACASDGDDVRLFPDRPWPSPH